MTDEKRICPGEDHSAEAVFHSQTTEMRRELRVLRSEAAGPLEFRMSEGDREDFEAMAKELDPAEGPHRPRPGGVWCATCEDEIQDLKLELRGLRGERDPNVDVFPKDTTVATNTTNVELPNASVAADLVDVAREWLSDHGVECDGWRVEHLAELLTRTDPSSSVADDPNGYREALERIAGMAGRATPIWNECADALCWARMHTIEPKAAPTCAGCKWGGEHEPSCGIHRAALNAIALVVESVMNDEMSDSVGWRRVRKEIRAALFTRPDSEKKP